MAVGLFFPLAFLFFFNLNVVVGISEENDFLSLLIYLTLGCYILVALRGSGTLSNDQNKQRSKTALQSRPYLEHPQMSCQPCAIIKAFRAFHCPVCKTCVPKFTRHSLVFASCIGAANELLACLFFGVFGGVEFYILWVFLTQTSYGLVTQVMFCWLNGFLCWESLCECVSILILV